MIAKDTLPGNNVTDRKITHNNVNEIIIIIIIII